MSSQRDRISPLRTELSVLVREETGCGVGESNAIVSRFLDAIVAHISSNEVTEIRGFGSFKWVKCKARTFTSGLFKGKTIPSYWRLRFRSKSIKEKM